MSEKTIAKVSELLNQEKWTRTSLTNYTNQHFKDMDILLEEIFIEEASEAVLEITDEHLAANKHSISALYLTGIIHIRKQSINDGYLITLINIFLENNRYKIAELLSESMLEFGENRFALLTLARCAENEHRMDDKFTFWERLINVDFDEAEIVEQIANRYEEQGNIEKAVSFFKKSLHRYINHKQFNHVREIWKKLLKHTPDDVDFLLHAEGKIAKFLGHERAVIILEDLYPVFEAAEQYELTLDVLKRILTYDSKNVLARKELVDCYREIYKDHSKLEDYINLSNLEQAWRAPFEAIADFEKHISFDTGNYVFHRSWGIGKIKSVTDDTIVIDFTKQKDHSMSLKLAVSALTILGKDHFWVHLINTPKEKMVKKVKEDIVWALKTIIKSFGNATDMKRVKAELSPRILTDSEWTSWSTKARSILKTDESFGNLPDKTDVFVVRDKPISLEEKTFNRFKAEKDYFGRVKIIYEFIDYCHDQGDDSGISSDQFREMLNYFIGFVKNPSQISVSVLASYLLVEGIVQKHPFLNPNLSLQFREVYEAIDDVRGIFDEIQNSELKKLFLHKIRLNVKNWADVYLLILPRYLQKDMVHELIRHGKGPEIEALFLGALGAYKEKREVFAWFVRFFSTEDWFASLNITQDKILFSLIHLLEICGREVENKKDTTENKRLQKQISSYLFKESILDNFFAEADEERISKVYGLLDDVKDLDPKLLMAIRKQISERFPDFNFFTGKEKEREIESVTRGGFFALAKSYEEKQRALQNLLEIEVPKNSKEIAAAREFGDLRENAEYKAAKERQELLNSTAARWKEEIEQAKLFNESDIDISKVSYGTIVSLMNNTTKENETYTIMGPWESHPEEKVISHLSPFGIQIAKKAKGEKVSFTINDRKYSYTIKAIKKVDFSTIKTTTPTEV